jgi:hypothetical protein
VVFAVALAVGACGLVGFGAVEISFPGGQPWAVCSFAAAVILMLLAASEDGDPDEVAQ